jgi:hypothetical protein
VGTGSGYLTSGGSYVTYVSPDNSDWSLVIEKFSNVGDKITQPETAAFQLNGWIRNTPSLHVWKSCFAIQPGENSSHFVYMGTVPITNGVLTLNITVDCSITASTIASASKGSHPTPPPATPFPNPYTDDFNTCVPPAEAAYWTDLSGSWECVDSGDADHGIVMRMVTPSTPITWEHDIRPHSLLGDMNWANTNFTADMRVPSGAVGVLGVRVSLMNYTNYAALMAEEYTPGIWWSMDSQGNWAVWLSIANVTVGGQIASGKAANILPSTWNTISLVVQDNTLAITLNGATLAESVDVRLGAYTGWVGLGTGSYGQLVDFDNIIVVAEYGTHA